ncbi:MAG: SurA N-terminal domain-containing protein, partial [Verrucomicrobiota bacterium]|nr:SurA N-terminal domain-containing protein [Verrucomicrobiota bacterium]
MFRLLLSLSLVLSSTLFAQQKSFNSLVAVVNGQAITESEVQEVTNATRNIIMLSLPEGPERQERLKSLRKNALDSLIERELILSEFIKMGGIIKDEIIDQDVQRIIDDEPFNGDRNKFLAEVKKAGTTMKRYKDQRRKILSVEIMKSR